MATSDEFRLCPGCTKYRLIRAYRRLCVNCEDDQPQKEKTLPRHDGPDF